MVMGWDRLALWLGWGWDRLSVAEPALHYWFELVSHRSEWARQSQTLWLLPLRLVMVCLWVIEW